MSEENEHLEIGERLRRVRTQYTELMQKDFAAKHDFGQVQYNG